MTPDGTHSPRWQDDPAELDRTLDGQLEPAALAARLAEADADPALAAHLAARRRFLEGLAGVGTHYRRELAAATPSDLEGRVRTSLTTPQRSPLRWAIAAAAVLLVGLGISLFADRGGHAAQAMPPAVIQAAEAARSPDTGPRGCETPAELSPLRFPPVREGSLLVWACVEKNGSTIAKLYRPEELPSVGYAAVPAPGVDPGPNVGRTNLGDTVVFDIAYGRKVHYLAVRTSWLERQRVLTPGRQSCRACHHLSRVGQDNPHKIVERSWRLASE